MGERGDAAKMRLANGDLATDMFALYDPPTPAGLSDDPDRRAFGSVTVVECDADSAALTRCLSLVARRLPFPAPGRAVSVDLPLMFQ